MNHENARTPREIFAPDEIIQPKSHFSRVDRVEADVVIVVKLQHKTSQFGGVFSVSAKMVTGFNQKRFRQVVIGKRIFEHFLKMPKYIFLKKISSFHCRKTNCTLVIFE